MLPSKQLYTIIVLLVGGLPAILFLANELYIVPEKHVLYVPHDINDINHHPNVNQHGNDLSADPNWNKSKKLAYNTTLMYSSKNNKSFNLYNLLNDMIEWDYTEPTLIVLGESCAGTSTLHSLFAGFTHFVAAPKKEPDFTRSCRPKHKYKYKPSHDKYKYIHRHWSIIPWKKEDYTDCSENDWEYYLTRIGYHVNRTNKIEYYVDASPQYVHEPYSAQILSYFAPHSKYILILREKMSNLYCRFNKLVCLKKKKIYNMDSCMTKSFKSFYHSTVTSVAFEKYLIPLLMAEEQTDKIRNKLISWLISFWNWNKKIRYKRWIMDICPYINILLFAKNFEHFNKDFASKQFKVVQMEYYVSNLKEMVALFYCYLVYDYESNVNENECVQYMLLNEDGYKHIVSGSLWKRLNDTGYHKSKSYNITSIDLNIFDGLSKFNNLCNQRLYEYLKDNLSLILGEFNIQIWFDKVQQWRDILLQQSSAH